MRPVKEKMNISNVITYMILRPSSVNFSSVAQSYPLFATPWTTARQASLSITNSRSPPKPMTIESVMPSNHLILCHPLLLLPSIFPVLSNESALCMRWTKYWSCSFKISPTNEHPGLISFRMDSESKRWFKKLKKKNQWELRINKALWKYLLRCN